MSNIQSAANYAGQSKHEQTCWSEESKVELCDLHYEWHREARHSISRMKHGGGSNSLLSMNRDASLS